MIAIPVQLLEIPEVVEIASLIQDIDLSEIIEATLPVLSDESRVALLSYLSQIESQGFMAELHTFTDKEVILITALSTELLSLAADAGMCGSA